MRICLSLSIAACVLLAACAHAPRPSSTAHTFAIVGATVVHPEQDAAHAAMPDATVVIRGDRIVAVGPSATTKVPDGAQTIDGKNRWLIPGMIDGHVHFFQSGNLYTRPDVADFNSAMPYAK